MLLAIIRLKQLRHIAVVWDKFAGLVSGPQSHKVRSSTLHHRIRSLESMKEGDKGGVGEVSGGGFLGMHKEHAVILFQSRAVSWISLARG